MSISYNIVDMANAIRLSETYNVKPEFFTLKNANGDDYVTEACNNSSVVAVIEAITDSVEEHLIKNAAIDIYSNVTEFTDDVGEQAAVYLLENGLLQKEQADYAVELDTDKIVTKAQTIFMHTLITMGSSLLPFIKAVQYDYEQIINEPGMLTDDVYKAFVDETGIDMDLSMFCDCSEEHSEKSKWFSRRIALYNPGVNFEHVCMIIDMMIKGLIQPNKYVLYPFIYIITNWILNRDVTRFFMYHMIKLIRVYFMGKLNKKFSPVNMFTNLSFGNKIDSNVEIYGDIRLSLDTNDVLSMFSLTPRTSLLEEDSSIDTNRIFFNWNSETEMIRQLTSLAFEFTGKCIKRQFKASYTTESTFNYLTQQDIAKRSEFIKKGVRHSYVTHRFLPNDKCLDRWTVSILAVARLENKNLRLIERNTKFYEKYKNHKIYVTYTNQFSGKVETIKTVFNLSDFIDRYIKANMKDVEHDYEAFKDVIVIDGYNDKKRIDYIPEARLESGYVKRTVYTKQISPKEYNREMRNVIKRRL